MIPIQNLAPGNKQEQYGTYSQWPFNLKYVTKGGHGETLNQGHFVPALSNIFPHIFPYKDASMRSSQYFRLQRPTLSAPPCRALCTGKSQKSARWKSKLNSFRTSLESVVTLQGLPPPPSVPHLVERLMSPDLETLLPPPSQFHTLPRQAQAASTR